MTTPICFVDTETDGVHPGRRPWEIAIIRRDEYGEGTTHFFVEIDLSTADPFGLKVGRFWDRHPDGRYLSGQRHDPPEVGEEQGDGRLLDRRDAAEEVSRCTFGAHIVGAVPNFDTETLAGLLRAHGLTPAWHYHLIDVEALAVGYLAGGGGQRRRFDDDRGWRDAAALPWSSDELSRALSVEPPGEEERHTALGDARWAMRMYDAVTEGSR